MSGPWSPTVFRENAYIPAAVRATMVAENRASFLLAKGASYPGELDIYNTSESVNEFDTRVVPLSVSTGRWATNGTCAWPCRPARRRR